MVAVNYVQLLVSESCTDILFTHIDSIRIIMWLKKGHSSVNDVMVDIRKSISSHENFIVITLHD